MPTAETQKRRLTPPQLAREWGISSAKVHQFIRSGELRAVNLATNPAGRPRFFIDRKDVEWFEARRAARPEIRPQRRQRNRAGVQQFI